MGWLKTGLRIIGRITGAMAVVEKIASAIPGLKGKDKADAALALASELLAELGGPYAGLLDDPRVRADADAFMAATVKLQNTLALVAAERGVVVPEA
jgi:hypothetical protein